VVESLLLVIANTITVPATTEKFIAREKFVINTSRKANVLISFLGDNFNKWFIGKEEDPIAGQILRYGKLRKNSVDGPIITELGGEAKAETTLSELFHLMDIQWKGQKGILLTNGSANIFYIKDVSGVLRAVNVRWNGDGWHVGAYSVENPDEWREGRLVFSRNSLSR
jgi:hypothetical protein